MKYISNIKKKTNRAFELLFISNGSGDRATGLLYTSQARGHGFDSWCSHKFSIVQIIIPVWWFKKPYGSLC